MKKIILILTLLFPLLVFSQSGGSRQLKQVYSNYTGYGSGVLSVDNSGQVLLIPKGVFKQVLRMEDDSLGFFDETDPIYASDSSYIKSELRALLDSIDENRIDTTFFVRKETLNTGGKLIKSGNIRNIEESGIVVASDNSLISNGYLQVGKDTIINGITSTMVLKMVGNDGRGSTTFLTHNRIQNNLHIGQNSGFLANGQELIGIGTHANFSAVGAAIISIGPFAGSDNIGSDNINIGTSSGSNNSGSNTIFIGANSGTYNLGHTNIGIGEFSSYESTGVFNTAIGFRSARNNKGNSSVGVGWNSISYNVGNYVTGIGYSSLSENTGQYVTGIGNSSASINSGNYVSVLGTNTAKSNTGDFVSGLGYYALSNNTGNYVDGIGSNVLQNNNADSVVGLGSYALRFTSSKAYNLSAIGYKAAVGTYNNPIKYFNATAIGANSTINSSNSINLGDSYATNFYIANKKIFYTPLAQGSLGASGTILKSTGLGSNPIWGTETYVTDSNRIVFWADTLSKIATKRDLSNAGGISGSGNSNYLVKWSGTNTQTNSALIDAGVGEVLMSRNQYFELGYGNSGNRISFIDFTTDDIYSDFGLRLIRNGNNGSNAPSELINLGTGELSLKAGAYGAPGSISLYTGDIKWFTIGNQGSIGMNTNINSTIQTAINSTTGNNLRLIFNNTTGNPTYYTDFITNSGGNLRINPSGGRVGINKTPSFDFDIQGDVNYVGTLYKDGRSVEYFDSAHFLGGGLIFIRPKGSNFGISKPDPHMFIYDTNTTKYMYITPSGISAGAHFNPYKAQIIFSYGKVGIEGMDEYNNLFYYYFPRTAGTSGKVLTSGGPGGTFYWSDGGGTGSGDITEVTGGNGLGGGGDTGSVSLHANTRNSITIDEDYIQLVGDDNPITATYYGTNSSGAKGFYNLPTTTTGFWQRSGSILTTLNTNDYVRLGSTQKLEFKHTTDAKIVNLYTPAEGKLYFNINSTSPVTALKIDNGYIGLNSGYLVNEFSRDSTLGGALPSHYKIPTQQAIKKYVDGISGVTGITNLVLLHPLGKDSDAFITIKPYIGSTYGQPVQIDSVHFGGDYVGYAGVMTQYDKQITMSVEYGAKRFDNSNTNNIYGIKYVTSGSEKCLTLDVTGLPPMNPLIFGDDDKIMLFDQSSSYSLRQATLEQLKTYIGGGSGSAIVPYTTTTTSWNIGTSGRNKNYTMSANTTISLSNLVNGDIPASLIVTPSTTNTYTLSFQESGGTALFYANGHSSTFYIKAGINIRYHFTFRYNGDKILVDYATYSN